MPTTDDPFVSSQGTSSDQSGTPPSPTSTEPQSDFDLGFETSAEPAPSTDGDFSLNFDESFFAPSNPNTPSEAAPNEAAPNEAVSDEAAPNEAVSSEPVSSEPDPMSNLLGEQPVQEQPVQEESLFPITETVEEIETPIETIEKEQIEEAPVSTGTFFQPTEDITTTFEPIADAEATTTFESVADAEATTTFEPAPTYEPTPEAFDQTVQALNSAKSEGNMFVSSEELTPTEETPETSEENKMLNLDQMVAKFQGEETPVEKEETPAEEGEEDPFEPMKKALEEEEKKDLLKKGVEVDENTMLIIHPEGEEASPEEEDSETDPEKKAPPATIASMEIPGIDVPLSSSEIAELETPESTTQETVEEIPVIEEIPAPQSVLSLDDIVNTPDPSQTTSTQTEGTENALQTIKNPLPIERFKKIWVVAGGVVVVWGLLFVGYTMFLPDLPSSSKPIPEITDTRDPSTQEGSTEHNAGSSNDDPSAPTNINPGDNVMPSDNWPQITDPICSSSYNGQSLVTLSSNDILCMIGTSSDFLETETGRSRQCNEETHLTSTQCSAARETGDVRIDTNLPAQKTSQDMIRELASFANSGKLYLDVGEMDNDKCIVKYAGYIQYQAEFLKSRLEKGETLDIEEYNTRTNRMSNILSKLDAYLSGETLPECSENTDTENIFDPDLEKQELQDYIYSQNGLFFSQPSKQ